MAEAADAVLGAVTRLALNSFYEKINKNSEVKFTGSVNDDEFNNGQRILIIGPEGVGKTWVVRRLIIEEELKRAITSFGPQSSTLKFGVYHGNVSNMIIVDSVGLGSSNKLISTNRVMNTIRQANRNGLDFHYVILVINPNRDSFNGKLKVYEMIIDGLKLGTKLDNLIILINCKDDINDNETKLEALDVWRQCLTASKQRSLFEVSDYLKNVRDIMDKNVFLITNGVFPDRLLIQLSTPIEPVSFSDAKCG
jgi:predicted GTPase